jgi:hypothetical protein
MNEGRDVWSGGTLREKSDTIKKSLRTTLRNIVQPKDVIHKIASSNDTEIVEKDFVGEDGMPGLGNAMGLGRFRDKNARPENPPVSPFATRQTATAVAKGFDVGTVLKETGYDKLPMTDRGREILQQILERGGKPITEFSGRMLINRDYAEPSPAHVRVPRIDAGDRVIVLPWVNVGVQGASFDLPYVPETMRVKKTYFGPAKVTKNVFPPGKAPADPSKEELVEENRLWAIDLEPESMKKDDEGLACCPMATREPTMILRLEPLATPAGEVAPQ